MAIRKVISRSILDGTVAPIDTNGIVTNLSVSALSASIAGTATDVFVYDTRKDSDGGAWRKRTNHTSWYNETLNTATRGSRRDFPAVAVIVVTSTAVTIYDGDSPDLPMWMVMNAQLSNGATADQVNYINTINYAQFWVTALTACSAVNGSLIVTNANYVPIVFEFASDRIKLITGSFGAFTGGTALYSLPISGRNSPGTFTRTSSILPLSAEYTNVTMTVLPNAPIDVNSGLPAPTIAIATNVGASIIHNNGTAANITCNNAGYTRCRDIEFLPGGALGLSLENSDPSQEDSFYVFNTPPTVNTVITVDSKSGSPISADAFYSGQANNGSVDVWTNAYSDKNRIHTAQTQLNFGTTFGLSKIAEERTNPSTGLVAYINTAYNTGWMPGRTTLALMSNSTAETLTGAELITNGGFASASNWSVTGGWAISAGVATCTNTVSSNLSQTISVTTGKTYILSFTVSGISGTANLQPTFDGADSAGQITSNGTFFLQMTATAARSSLLFYVSGNGSVTIDNVSLRLADPDRSQGRANIALDGTGRPIGVVGSVIKAAVAAGNDLVSYSGWDSGYLEQPYNSALDYGTGDFYYSMWVKTDSTATYSANTYLFERSSISDTSARRIEARISAINTLQVFALNTTVVGAVPIPVNAWFKFELLRRGSTMYVYINGQFVSSAANMGGSVTDTAASLVIGNRAYFTPRTSNLTPTTQIALFKSSSTAPTDAQITRMYNDEKQMFQTGAKACLYGSSNTVTALAYDDGTDYLHVGTSSGRSVFDGLRRVDNTTTGVTTTIGASNGLVAEQ